VPIPDFALVELTRHLAAYPSGPDGYLFTNSAGGPFRRGQFRTRVWRPALVRAGLLGDVAPLDGGTFLATWVGIDGGTQSKTYPSEREAVAAIAQNFGTTVRL